jgi:CRISPR-associated protein Csd1
MILQQLYRDASVILGEDVPPPMYDLKPVRRLIVLMPGRGEPHIVTLEDAKKRGQPHLIPYPGPRSGSVIRPNLLADTAAFVLGVAPDDHRAATKHAAFKALVHRCAEETGDPLVAAVDTFLTDWNPESEQAKAFLAANLPDLAATDTLSFRVGEEWPVDVPAVRAFWAKSARAAAAPSGGKTSDDEMECLVTGVRGPVDRSLSGMIKGIPGGQSSGTALVSANSPAFESFGRLGAHNSPLSREAAETFTKSLNKLLAGEKTRLYVGDVVYVFWTSEGPDEDTGPLIGQADPQKVRELLNAARSGKKEAIETIGEDNPDQASPSAFHAAGLSASGGRAVVRDWITCTVPEVKENLAGWFDAQAIIGPGGEAPDTDFFSVFRLASAMYRDARKDMPRTVPPVLIRAALHGKPLPGSVLHQAVLRSRAEQRVTRNRAALMKAALVLSPDNPDARKEMSRKMMVLDPTNTRPAYLCGRLLAELEVIQRESARPSKLNTTLVDRYFGAASTTPATVFGILLTSASKAHLPKLRKSRPAVCAALQRRLEEIMALLTGPAPFPSTLALADQALFSLGYYHQRAQDRRDAAEAKARKEQGKATATDAVVAEIDEDAPTTDTTDDKE